MKILALEFSAEQRSAAILDSALLEPGALLFSSPALLAECAETGARPFQPFALLEAALRAARLEREQIECLAVGLGPGSYTGIRVAISIAQGWQLAREVKLLGVSSVEALAVQAQAETLPGEVHFVIDAQRHEVYLATYRIHPDRYEVVEPLRLAALEEVKTRYERNDLVAGPEANRWFERGRLMYPRAAAIAGLAAWRTHFIPGEQLEPIYLRQANFVKAPPPRIIP